MDFPYDVKAPVATVLLAARRWLLMGLLGAGTAFGQISGGTFRGDVRDASNAVIPHVRILIRSLDNGTEIGAESNEDGLYITPAVIPGIYTLTATKPGFQAEVVGPVSLQIAQTVRVDFSLKVGAVSDTVVVESTAAQLLSVESSEVAQVINRKEVAEIPLNGRSWQQLIALSAGVNPGAPGETGSPNAVNVNGQRTKANLFLVDGISTTSSSQGRGNSFNMPIEAVREFSVQAGSYSAEYGNVAGGVVNLVSRSGTNQWHGSVFEFFRNDQLDASNFFSNATGQPKSPLRYNQFGAALGGPIRRDRTFFFADYQGTISHAFGPMISSLPLDAQRTGDFSGLRDATGAMVPIYDPFGASTARAPFPGNAIPVILLDPAAVRLTALLPKPNQFGTLGEPLPFNNYAVTRGSTAAMHSFDVRLDHQLSSKSMLFARHSLQDTNAITHSLFGLPLGGPPAGAGTTRARNQNTGVGWTHQISPLLIQEMRVGLHRVTTALTQEDYGQDLSQQFGIPGVNRGPDTSGLSSLNVAGLFSLGGSMLTPLRLATTSWTFGEKLMWAQGHHTIRIGFDYAHEMGSTGYLVFGRGSYSFLSQSTGSQAAPTAGNAFASFLVGAPFQVSRDIFPPGMVGLSAPRYGVYAQDDVKIARRLTLNLGGRYDIMPYAREKYDRLSNFDPATRTMLLAGQDTSSRLRATDYKNLAPRIGLAFVPSADFKTVIRAGYGIGFIDPVGGAGILNSTEFNIPFYFRDTVTQFPFSAPTYRLSSLLPALAVPSPLRPTGDQRYLVPTDRNQYSQTWSLSVQRAVYGSWMWETAYVGTSGNRLLTTANINTGAPGTTNPVARRPFGAALGEIRQISNSAHSTYHGLQSKMEKRFSRGLYFLGSYTWSKSLDNQSNGTDDSAASGQNPQNPLNPSADRGLSSFDRTHRLVASGVWEIPFGRAASGANSNFARNVLTRGVLGGWQLSGILQTQTGTPFSVVMPCAAINAEGNNCRPNRIASGELPEEQRSLTQWFDKSAFVTPLIPAYGNAGRNILRGPGSINVDLAISKSFPWNPDRARRLQVRAEFFNALNHTNFGLPVHATNSPAFGTITSAGPARVIQIAARLEF